MKTQTIYKSAITGEIVSKEFADLNPRTTYKTEVEQEKVKHYGNTTISKAKQNVSDLVVFGEDVWKLISKASSQEERWMKSTKAMQLPTGCLIQVTTQQGGNVAESVTFVPGIKIEEFIEEENKEVTLRKFIIL